MFAGYLIKNAVTGNINNSFILRGSYKPTPNMREELEAYRDDNTRDLVRVTAEGKKSKIEFQTIPMDLTQKMQMQNFFNSAMVDTLQRKVHLYFWNDETNAYQEGYFYLPDIQFKIDEFTEDTIYYDSITISLVEY